MQFNLLNAWDKVYSIQYHPIIRWNIQAKKEGNASNKYKQENLELAPAFAKLRSRKKRHAGLEKLLPPKPRYRPI